MSARDWSELVLAPGERLLIEASAGTGKTWTITALYLRLLLEQARPVGEIAVTTFTDAAAQELRERLRRRLHAAERLAAEPARAATDAAETWLLARWQQAGLRGQDRLRLRLALAELDHAPIGTLHALCRKVLADQPFAAASGFRLGELVAEPALREELLRDLRRYLAHVPADGLRRRALDALAGQGDQALAQLLGLILDEGTELALPEAGPLQALAALFGRGQADAVTALVARTAWTRSNAALRARLLELAEALAGDDWMVALKLTPALLAEAELQKQIKADGLAAWHADPLSRWLVEAAELLARREALLRGEALREIAPLLRQWRAERLAARDQFSFDDLINRVLQALRESDGSAQALAQRLHASWPVVLIDEFQDTDARQYAIFDRICRDADGGRRGLLVMIGDPKQAIYAFRGGDIHAYLRAAAGATQHLGLATNHRSSRALVAALNGFYALAGDGFGNPDIPYPQVAASGRCDDAPLRIDGARVERPLCIRQLGLDDCPPNKDARAALALHQCADEIAALLQPGRVSIGAAPLQPGDIAVLLPNNRQVVELRRLLQARRVPCVGAGRSSVFASPWAEALRLVLYAALHPGDPAALRAALASALIGLDFNALQALADDPPGWSRWVDRCHRWQQHWQQRGVLAVVAELLAEAAPRLLAGSDGERALTDLRHLGELLQQQGQAMAGGEQLLVWFERQCAGLDEDDASDERQLRIESDHRRVQLMTLHASKGLEFPLVMLPLMSLHEGRAIDIPVLSDPDRAGRVADLGTRTQAAARQRAADEAQQERLRVLYVALTRARHYCVVLAMPPGRARDGGRKDVAADPERSALDRLLAAIEVNRATGQGDAAPIDWCMGWNAEYQCLAAPVTSTATRHALSPPPRRPPLASHSFTTLSRGRRPALVEDESAAIDEALPEPRPWPGEPVGESMPALQALAALRGADFGNAVHAIFEHRDPQRPLPRQPELVRRALLESGARIDSARFESLAAALAERLQACLDADLGGGLRLSALAPAAQRAEMAFHFQLDGVEPEQLRAICLRHGEPDLLPASLGQRPLRGFMTGKIDLCLLHDGRCHVLDYKSNQLGAGLADYRGAALEQAMQAHHYPFQALLYTLALDRYLRQRQPGYARERHLGDAIYLFVRAVGLDGAAGIWRRRFAPALIAELDAALAQGVGVVA